MRYKTHTITKIIFIGLCAMGPIQNVLTMDMDDFSTLFEDMFDEEKNPFIKMFNQSDEGDSKSSPSSSKEAAKPVVLMPKPERLILFETTIQKILEPLGRVIENMHFDHVILGGLVHERTQEQKGALTGVESILLHLSAIQTFLPAKEIEPFIKLLEKESGAILALLNEILTTATKSTPTTVEAENAFILGETDKSPVFMPTSERRKLETKINSLGSKIKPLTTGLEKLLAAPEIRKLFPEPKITPIRLSAPRSSSSPSSSYAHRPHNSSGKKTSSRYNDNFYDPYGSNYSSDYPYDSYGNPEGSASDKSADNKENQPKELAKGSPAPEEAKKQKKPQGTLVELVAQLTANETVSALQETLSKGSLLKSSDYFERMATAFESIFKQSPDGGLETLVQLLKSIEAEKTIFEKKIKDKAEKTKDKPTPPQGEQPNPLISPEKKEKQAKKKALKTKGEEALSDYLQTKEAIASALIRLLYTPTKQSVVEQIGAHRSIAQKPIVVSLLPEHKKIEIEGEESQNGISRNSLDQENEFCLQTQKTIGQFLNLLDKKLGMKTYIELQKKQLNAEIDQLEAQRTESIRKIAENLKTSEVSAETFKKLIPATQTLTDQAFELRRKSPTVKTNEIHFYNIAKARKDPKSRKALTKEEEKALAAGRGTTRSKVTKGLKALEKNLSNYKPAEVPQEYKNLQEAISTALADWQKDLIITLEQPPQNYAEQPLNPKLPAPLQQKSSGMSPQDLQKLMQEITGKNTGTKK